MSCVCDTMDVASDFKGEKHRECCINSSRVGRQSESFSNGLR